MDDSGFTIEELCEILKHIEANNSWKNMYRNHCKDNKAPTIKYVNLSFDTRDCRIWRVEFSGGKDGTVFRTEKDYDLKEKVYEFLRNQSGELM